MKNKIVYVNLLQVTYTDATSTETKTFQSLDAVLMEVARLLDDGYDLVSSNGSSMTLRYDPDKKRYMGLVR